MKKIALALLLTFAFTGLAMAADDSFYTQQNIELDGNWGDSDC
ncbi:MAG: hypothetical protein OEZ68_08765 [Gammaproteobacteria bacterium]|nr:hypothetical protein [Gammaproteobacteria bacterium]MDH5800878.1 hypothetical protein [Gammaproteobacteria bacterium]